MIIKIKSYLNLKNEKSEEHNFVNVTMIFAVNFNCSFKNQE